MDVIEFLTKQENYLSNGLYWCLREDDEVNSTLEKLLWRDRVYPIFEMVLMSFLRLLIMELFQADLG